MRIFSDIWQVIRKEVFVFPSTERLFNQYKDDVPGLDLPGGAGIRRENLRNYLRGFRRKPAVLVVGEAAGPWGCRFSGIPFTGERQLANNELPFKGRPSSVHEPPYSERSGTVLWKTLLTYYPDFMLWNTVPFHPHKEGELLSIRRPKNDEVRACSGVLLKIVSLLEPSLVAAVGRVAENALKGMGVAAVYVRHPSNGGSEAFREGIKGIFRHACDIIRL